MLARIRRSMEEKDQGFTLIELLVVMIIIGILAAIAIPVFLNQRKRAVDSSIKSDLRTIANQMETVYTDRQRYTDTWSQAGTTVTVGADTVQASAGNSFTYVLLSDATHALAVDATNAAAASGFCLTGSNSKTNNTFHYNSLNGGVGNGACPTA
jgi:prepilin-type N-terminal cleavage/methylation domain-containing protein